MTDPSASMPGSPFGTTRTRVTDSYAVLAPDGHVLAPLASWRNTQGVILISPAMGAAFVQYLALAEEGSSTDHAAQGIERFIYVEAGEARFESPAANASVLAAGHYIFVPADTEHHLEATQTSRLWVFEKPFERRAGTALPEVVVGDTARVEGVPFMGDEDAVLKTLLPDEPEFDMAVNLFTYQSGATLPFVETHIMEHGLLMVEGMGVYRLGDDWHPVQQGDVIWLAPFCPQWFVAMGKQPASYLYYKDVNRDPLA